MWSDCLQPGHSRLPDSHLVSPSIHFFLVFLLLFSNSLSLISNLKPDPPYSGDLVKNILDLTYHLSQVQLYTPTYDKKQVGNADHHRHSLRDPITQFWDHPPVCVNQFCQGRNCLVHCAGGSGRTGMVIAAVIKNLGVSNISSGVVRWSWCRKQHQWHEIGY